MLKYLILLLPIALDVRGEEVGGGLLQFVSFGLTFFAAVLIVFFVKDFVKPGGASLKIGILLQASIVSSVVVNFFSSVPSEQFLRVLAPYVLFVMGYFISSFKIKDCEWRLVVNSIIICSAVSVAFTAAYGFLYTDFGLLDVRFQILSPLLPIYISVVSVCYFIVSTKRGWFLIFAFPAIALVLISATRNAMFTVVSIVFFSDLIRRAASGNGVISLLKSIASVVVFVLVVSVGLFCLNEDVFYRVFERFFVGSDTYDFDASTITRVAEIKNQMDLLFESVWTLFFGKGVGATFGFSGEYFRILSQVLPYEDVDVQWWAGGHNFWVYSLFSQGFLFGWIYPFVIVISLILFVHLILKLPAARRDPLFLIGGMGVVAFIHSTLGGNPLGPRAGGLYYGLLVGILMRRYDYFRSLR